MYFPNNRHVFGPAVLLMVACFLLVGCGKSAEEKSEEYQLNDEVMKVHDDLMMRSVADKLEQVTQELNNLENIDRESLSDSMQVLLDETEKSLKTTAEQLAKAQKDMNEWMVEHGNMPELENIPHDKAMNMLNEFKESIEQLRQDYDEAFNQAQEALKNARILKEEGDTKS